MIRSIILAASILSCSKMLEFFFEIWNRAEVIFETETTLGKLDKQG